MLIVERKIESDLIIDVNIGYIRLNRGSKQVISGNDK